MESGDKKTAKLKAEELIRLKHSDMYICMFKKAEGKPMLLKKAWETLAEELGGDPKVLKTQYNQLLTKFRLEHDQANKTGGSPSRWRYWEIFSKTFPKNKRTKMENVLELGSGKEEITNSSIKEASDLTIESNLVKKIPQKETSNKKEMEALKIAAYKSIIKLNETEISSKKRRKKESKRLKNLEKNISDLIAAVGVLKDRIEQPNKTKNKNNNDSEDD